MNLEKFKPETLTLIRFFLGATFLAQGIRALSHQPDFMRLAAESPFLKLSFAPDFFTPGVFLLLVGIFDITISLLLFTGKAPRAVAIHGFAWICLVIFNSLVIGRIIETIDSVGYLGGLLALIIWNREEMK